MVLVIHYCRNRIAQFSQEKSGKYFELLFKAKK